MHNIFRSNVLSTSSPPKSLSGVSSTTSSLTSPGENKFDGVKHLKLIGDGVLLLLLSCFFSFSSLWGRFSSLVEPYSIRFLSESSLISFNISCEVKLLVSAWLFVVIMDGVEGLLRLRCIILMLLVGVVGLELLLLLSSILGGHDFGLPAASTLPSCTMSGCC